VISDDDLARASKNLIITTERIITSDEIRNDPDRTVIPYYLVDAVCEVPFGAYPGAMPYEYSSDETHLKEWLTVQNNQKNFADFLKRNIHECPDHETYIERNGGISRIQELRSKELLIQKGGINAEV
jgi:glutaconate CoA-transferase, subunit A